MAAESDCIFCKIVRGEIPSAKVYEDDNVLAFVDIAPVNPGHVLVIPKRHAVTLFDLPQDDGRDCMEAILKVAAAVKDASGWPGLNLIQNNGECAGQVVPHCHFHLIPRHPSDGMRFGWRQQEYGEGEMEEWQDKIKAKLK